MTIPEEIKFYLNKPVAIIGAGVSGIALSELLKKLNIEYKLYDEKAGHEAERSFDSYTAKEHDLIVYSPGFPSDHKWLVDAKKAGCALLGELDFASLFWKGKIIAVTGTNGKTTITSFITRSLKRLGVNAIAAGNIGIPLSRILLESNSQESTIVCETSSFQAEEIKYFSPDVLIWSNFAEDHLNRYDSLDSYFKAKLNLVQRLKSEQLYIGKSVLTYANENKHSLPEGARVIELDDISTAKIPENSIFKSYPQQENYLLVKKFWDENKYPESSLKQTVASFTLPEHRLQKIGELKGIHFWNDSKATNFSATIAALRSFPHPVLWIGGGLQKGGDLKAFARSVSYYIKKAYIIGSVSDSLAQEFNQLDIAVSTYENLNQAVNAAFKDSTSPEEIVFSPGFASFDMYPSFAHRGNAFLNDFNHLKNTEANTCTQ